ncbi:MAG: CHASE3 domain-containing protein [Beijerinckiaceae bacterium]
MPISNASFIRSALALLGAGLVILIILAGSSVWLSERTRENAADVLEAQRIRAGTSHLLALLLDAESAQRGFLLTHETAYLEPYRIAVGQVTADLDLLKTMHQGDASQTELVEHLSTVIQEKFAELAHTIALAEAEQRPEALEIVNTDRGRKLTDDAREKLTGLLNRADARLNSDVRAMTSDARFLSFATIAGAILVFLVGSGSLFIVVRHTRDVIAARTEVLTLNETLEERVKERTTDLARANEEIQRFAYIVSHDLRAPLVNIMGFTSELEVGVSTVEQFLEQVGGGEGEAARAAVREDMPEAIGFIRASTKRMDRLINAILRLSREGRRTLAPERINLETLLEQLMANVQHQLSEAGGKIAVVKPIPMLVSDRLALEQIFGNLIDNAVKYLDAGRPGRISISASEQGRLIHFDIADNGRGIAAQDHDRIFDLFRRSGVQDRQGEGIGLAHVRALVRRLGGDISVKSELGAGTTFRVSLPRVFRQTSESVAS